MEYNITNPDIHQYLTKENFEMVIDTFYEIEPDFDEEKALEMTILANYFLAPFLTKKCIRILVNDMVISGKCFDLLEFAKQWSLDQLAAELHKAIVENFPTSLSKPKSFYRGMSENSKLTKLKRKNDTRGSSMQKKKEHEEDSVILAKK